MEKLKKRSRGARIITLWLRNSNRDFWRLENNDVKAETEEDEKSRLWRANPFNETRVKTMYIPNTTICRHFHSFQFLCWLALAS